MYCIPTARITSAEFHRRILPLAFPSCVPSSKGLTRAQQERLEG